MIFRTEGVNQFYLAFTSLFFLFCSLYGSSTFTYPLCISVSTVYSPNSLADFLSLLKFFWTVSFTAHPCSFLRVSYLIHASWCVFFPFFSPFPIPPANDFFFFL